MQGDKNEIIPANNANKIAKNENSSMIKLNTFLNLIVIY